MRQQRMKIDRYFLGEKDVYWTILIRTDDGKWQVLSHFRANDAQRAQMGDLKEMNIRALTFPDGSVDFHTMVPDSEW